MVSGDRTRISSIQHGTGGYGARVVAERRPTQVQRQNERAWMHFCAQAAVEQDPDKLLELVEEINRMLEVKEGRLEHQRNKGVRRSGPMAAHILHVAYCPTLQETQALRLKSAGYEVTSVLGNDNARTLDAAVIAAAELIVVGFCAPHSVRLKWFFGSKHTTGNFPSSPCSLVGGRSSREADVSAFSEDPTIWLEKIASILKSLALATDEATRMPIL
jgi:hypothetical protein